jgi:hypothetical protein
MNTVIGILLLASRSCCGEEKSGVIFLMPKFHNMEPLIFGIFWGTKSEAELAVRGTRSLLVRIDHLYCAVALVLQAT